MNVPSSLCPRALSRTMLAGIVAFAAASPCAWAGTLQAFSGVVGGAGSGSIPNGCTTYGPPAELGFYGGFTGGLQVLGGNAACGYSGGWTNKVSTGSTATVLNSASLAPTVLGNPGFAESFDGTAASRAAYGSLGATAHGSYSGTGDYSAGTTIAESTAAASFSDTLTASVSHTYTDVSSNGFVRYRFELDGSMSTPGVSEAFHNGEALTALLVQQNGGPTYNLMDAETSTGSVGYFNGAPTTGGGWTVLPGSVSGSSEIDSSMFAVDLLSSWDVEVGLIVNAFGNADDTFYNSAKLIGIDLYDSMGNPISDFTLSAGSGTDYLAPPVIDAVPEPSTFSLMAIGALAAFGARAARKRKSW